MWGAAANLSPQMAHYLADYFSTLLPKAADDGFRELAALGASIYQDGIPDSNIVACIACHGPNADTAAKFPMPRIASSLSPDQIEALASYLSFVR
jgi:cytochrome c553